MCTLWKLRNFTATVVTKILLKNFTINWFDGKKFALQWISRFSTLCAPQYRKKLLSPKNISSNHLFSNFFSKDVGFTKFLPKYNYNYHTMRLAKFVCVVLMNFSKKGWIFSGKKACVAGNFCWIIFSISPQLAINVRNDTTAAAEFSCKEREDVSH